MQKLFLVLISGAIALSCGKKQEANTTTPMAIPPATAAKHEAYSIADSSKIKDLGDGLKLYVVEEGAGIIPKPNSNVIINYHGRLRNGQVFDSSFDRGQVADFNLGSLIEGWKRGLTQVKTGSKIVLIVPPALGYGSQDKGNIPPNSTLLFDIDLIGTY